MNVIYNLRWLLSVQALRLSIGFILGIWIARALGPVQFGILSTAGALAMLGGVFGEFGMRQILLKEITQNPNSSTEIAGTVFKLWLLFGALWTIILYIWNAIAPQPIAWSVFVPTVLPVTLLSFNLNHIWEDASHRAYVTSRNGMISYLSSSALKVLALCFCATLPIIAWTICIESLFCFILAAWTGVKHGRGFWLKGWNPKLAKRLLGSGAVLLLSQAGALLLLRVDTLMLQSMCGENETGIYAAAVRFSEMVYVLAPLMISVLMPHLAKAKEDHALFKTITEQGSKIMMALALGPAVVLLLIGSDLLPFLYGQEYQASSLVLTVHCLATIPHFQSEWRQAILVASDQSTLSAIFAWSALAINVVLNWLWIPQYGSLGAAWATLISYTISGFIGTWLFKELHWFGRQQLKALTGPLRWLMHPLQSASFLLHYLQQLSPSTPPLRNS